MEVPMTGCVAKGPTADTFVVSNIAEKGAGTNARGEST
jgi:hypothetical protein